MRDPDLAYFDKLPFLGWTIPDGVRITDGNYKPLAANAYTPVDMTDPQRVAKAEAKAAARLARAEAEDARRAEARRIRKEQEAEASRLRHEISKKMQEEKRALNEAKQIRKELERAKPLLTPHPKPRRPERTKEELRAQRAKWQREKRQREREARNNATPKKSRTAGVVVHYPSGDITYQSIGMAAKALKRASATIRQGVARGNLVCGLDITIIRADFTESSKANRIRIREIEIRDKAVGKKPMKIRAKNGNREIIFRSINVASAGLGLSRSTVSNYVMSGRSIEGWTLEKVDSD